MLRGLVKDRIQRMWNLIVGSLGSKMPNGEQNSNTKQQYKDDDDYYFTEFTFLRFWSLFGCSQLVH
jgi:hypothetical protein